MSEEANTEGSFLGTYPGERTPLMRTVSFIDISDLGESIRLRITTYRTHVTVDVVKASHSS